MRIILIGFMGSGKSVTGKKLAAKLDCDFFDLDNLIEERYKMTIPALFAKFGEEQFRKLESKALKEILKTDNYVLSCGGGTPCFNNNMKLIKKAGISIYLKMTPKALSNRLARSYKKRPLIKDLPKEQLPDTIEIMLENRERFYNQSNITVNGLSLKMDDLISKIREY
jgi:shikimate kinase